MERNMMHSGNFNTMHGIVNVEYKGKIPAYKQGEPNGERMEYLAEINGITIGKIFEENGYFYYQHSVNEQNFITAVTDSFRDAAEELAIFAYKIGLI